MATEKKLILVACGAGIATSTVVCKRVEKLLQNHQILAEVIQCKIAEVGTYEDKADLLVTTTIAPRAFKMPVVKAVNYLTGMNTEKTDAEILNALQ